MSRNRKIVIGFVVLAAVASFCFFVYKAVNPAIFGASPIFGDSGIGVGGAEQWRGEGSNITQKTTGKGLKLTGFESLPCLGTNSSGVIGAGTCGSGSGGSGNVSTSSSETAGYLAYWTSTGATPATLGKVATGTLSASGPLAVTAGRSVIGGSAAISITQSGTGADGYLSSTDFNTFNNKIGWGQATSTSANQIVYTNAAGKLVSVASSSLALPNGALANSTISGVALGGSLFAHTVSGSLTGTSYNGSAAVSNWALNMANANTWTALQTFANASTTLGSFAYASSTLWYGGGLASTCAAGNFLTWTGGQFGCAADQTSAGGANPFIWASNYNAINAATSSIFWAQSGINASSTSHFVNASSSQETIGDKLWLSSLTSGALAVDGAGLVYKAGTSTPSAGGPITYSGTFGSMLGGASGNFGCTAASSGANGCLSSTDWSTFNSKQATIGVTWPITLSGATVGFNGLSTSSAIAAGAALLYATGVNTVASAATTTASCTTGASCTSFSILGASPVSITTTLGTSVDLASEITGDLPFANLTQGAANTVLANVTGGTADFAALATSSLFAGTAGQILARTSAGTWIGVATSTDSCSSGVSCSYAGGVNTFTNTGVTSNVAGAGIAVSGSTGAVTITNTIGYPFPSNATSSALSFTGLLTITNASTTRASFSYASSTLWYGGGLSSNCDSGNVLTWNSGRFGCATDQTAAGAANPFTWTTNYGAITAATSSNMWFQGNLFASSTAYFGTGGSGDAATQYGPDTDAWTIGFDQTDKSFAIASSTTLGTTNAMTILKTLAVSFAGQVTAAVGAIVNTFLQIPNGTAPTVDTAGEIAVDTTAADDQFLFFGAAKHVVVDFHVMRVSMASTTWGAGTTTLYMGPATEAMTFKQVYCQTDTGTLQVSLYDGTNRSNFLNASTTLNSNALSTNASFTKGESIRVDVGTAATAPKILGCSFKYTYDAQ